MTNLASLRKPADGIISRFLNRPVSLAITRRIANTPVRPNHVSVLTMILGISSGLIISKGGYGAGVFGALLLQMQSMLDGVDGELARLRFQSSTLGEWLDTLSDDLSELSFLVGLTLIAPFLWIRWLGIAGIVSLVATKAVIYHGLATVYHSGDILAFPWKRGKRQKILWQKFRFLDKHDFVCLFSLVLAVIGWIEIATVFIAIRAIVEFVSLMKQTVGRSAPERGSEPHP